MSTDGISPDEVLPAGAAGVVGAPGAPSARSRAGPRQRDLDGSGGAEVPEERSDELEPGAEVISEPAKVMRIGSMVKQLLDEVRQAPLDEAGRIRLREIHEQSVRELQDGLSPELSAELDRMAKPFDEQAPSNAELRVAQAQLVGWLEGLFHGIQAALMAQQMAARAQLEELRRRELPAAEQIRSGPSGGTYL